MSNGELATNHEVVRECRQCFLLGHDHVPSAGSLSAELMVITKHPSRSEIEMGEMLVGDVGTLVDGMLAEIPLGREDVYIAGIVKCRPNDGREPDPDEVEKCAQMWLRSECRAVSPKVILMMGGLAWKMVPKKWNPKNGKVLRNKNTSFIFCYSPVYFLRRVDLSGFLRVAELVKRELER